MHRSFKLSHRVFDCKLSTYILNCQTLFSEQTLYSKQAVQNSLKKCLLDKAQEP